MGAYNTLPLPETTVSKSAGLMLASGRTRETQSCTPSKTYGLREGVAEGLGIGPHARITRQHGDELRCFAERFCRGEVNGVECSDRLNGERPAGAVEHIVGDAHDIAPRGKGLETANGATFLARCQPATDPCAHHRPIRFDERQRGGNTALGLAQRVSR